MEMLENIQVYEGIEKRMNDETIAVMENLKQLNNDFQSMKGNIRVNIRLRPFLDSDPQYERSDELIRCPDRYTVQLTVPERVTLT